jgi:CubicO group peptidase (beta-lactamase class C family)
MKMLLLLLALASPIAWADTSVAPPDSLTRADLEAWLDGVVPYALARGDIAGAVVVVVKDGTVLLQKGYGYADVANRIPADAERTLFRTGSVGKLLTWTAVMQLVESGRLDLDRDINAYLDFRIEPRDGQPVTLRNLMTHTPGFEEVIKNLVASEPAALPSLGDYLKAWTPKRIYPPGQVPAYSNYGAALAGYIVERISGESFDDYVEGHVLVPLEMTSTTSRQPLPARFTRRMSQGYVLGSGSPRPFELVGPAPAGGFAATGGDMARFMVAYLQEGQLGSARILKPETVRQMFSSRLPVIPALNSMLLGFFQENVDGRRIVGHGGDSQYFHSSLDLFLDESVGIYVVINSSGQGDAAVVVPTTLVNEFAARYFPVPEDSRSIDPETAATHARQMTGTYMSSRRAKTTFFGLLNFLTQVEVMLDGNGELAIPALVSSNGQPMRWREVEPFVWHQVGGAERLAARVENGHVRLFSVDSVSPFVVFVPVPWWMPSAAMIPLLGIAVAILTFTIVTWPVSAILRRRLRVATTPDVLDPRVLRYVRLGAIAVLVVLAGWCAIFSLVSSNLSAFSPRLDPAIFSLRIATGLALVGTLAVASWNAWITWIRADWASRSWRALQALSVLLMLWFAVTYRLIGFSTDY